MKNLYGFLLLTLVVVSCGAPSGYFRLEGRFRNFNQGEFYLYSLDGRGRLDTIQVREGRFSYEAAVDDQSAFSLIFPNYSEIPLFAESGATVDVQGDASHLKEVKVAGTKENNLMTEFRLKVAEMTPPQALKEAEAFIRKNPTTDASLYLLKKYFLANFDPDYKKATDLCVTMLKKQPDNTELQQLRKQLQGVKRLAEGQHLPTFSAVDVRGQRVGNASLRGEANVVNVWSTWNYDSGNMMRQLRRLKKEYGSRLGVVSICVDASQLDCRRQMDRDSIDWSVVCDGRMLETPALAQLGIADIPFNLLVDRSGKIVAVNLGQTLLKDRIKKTLDKSAK